MAEFHTFLWLSTTLLYMCNTPSSPVHLLMDTWVDSIPWLLSSSAAMNTEVFHLFKVVFSFFFFPDIHSGVELLDHMVVLLLGFFFFFLIFVYLAASSVSGGCRIFCCGTRASLYLCVDSVVATRGLNCPVSCGILVPQPGIQPAFPVLEGGPPGKSLLLVFRGTSILFSMVVALTYIPTNSVQGFPFLHILANICYL